MRRPDMHVSMVSAVILRELFAQHRPFICAICVVLVLTLPLAPSTLHRNTRKQACFCKYRTFYILKDVRVAKHLKP